MSSRRSRFDEKESPRPSRFDKRSRSRSPPRVANAPPRERDPLPAKSPDASRPGAASAAAAAAARINAQINAHKGIQHVDVPPIRSATSNAEPEKNNSSTHNIGGDVYEQDGDYIKDIEVNDLRNRYTLTKGPTQRMIKEQTGADVTTRGAYYPDKSMATAANPPLYLHITSTTKEGLDKAVAKINELMQQDLPNLVDERRFKRREPEPFERDELGRRKWPEHKIVVGMESLPGFNLRAQVVGQGGRNVKHIQAETRCKVQIKGRGSGFMENATGQELDEPMFLHVAGPDQTDVDQAKSLCESLLDSVRQDYQQFKDNPPPRSHDGYGAGGMGAGGGYSQRGDDRDRRDGGRGGYGSQGGGYGGGPGGYHGGAAQPSAATAGAMPSGPEAEAYAAQLAQYYASTGQPDPYAAYGGYMGYMQYYQYYMQAQAAGQGSPPQQTGTPSNGGAIPPPPSGSAPPPPPPSGDAAPPPPPPSSANQPPPPPGASSNGGYSAVPPPPGL